LIYIKYHRASCVIKGPGDNVEAARKIAPSVANFDQAAFAALSPEQQAQFREALARGGFSDFDITARLGPARSSGSRIGLLDSAAAAAISVYGAAGSSGRRIGLGFVSTSFIGRLSQCRSSFWMFNSATRLECER
jgi:hypothetical protein